MYMILICSHQNDTPNLSLAPIQPHVERRPLIDLQFDAQRKIKFCPDKCHFQASYSSAVTFTPQNYAAKSNFRKCHLCY